MVNDSELLAMLMQKYPTKDADFIMGEFATYKRLMKEMQSAADCPACDAEQAEAKAEKETKEQSAEPVKKLTRRNLKHKPAGAISKDDIKCCVCGQKFKRLSAAHLKQHGATPELYREICGYKPDQPLMGRDVHKKLMEAVKQAQAARAEKRAAK